MPFVFSAHPNNIRIEATLATCKRNMCVVLEEFYVLRPHACLGFPGKVRMLMNHACSTYLHERSAGIQESCLAFCCQTERLAGCEMSFHNKISFASHPHACRICR